MTNEFKKEIQDLSKNFVSVLVGQTNELLEKCNFENKDQYAEMILNTLAQYNVACLSHLFGSKLIDEKDIDQIMCVMFNHVNKVVNANIEDMKNGPKN